MTSDEIKLCIEASIAERNHIVSEMSRYIRNYCNNMVLDTEYNKGFHDALVALECKLKEI